MVFIIKKKQIKYYVRSKTIINKKTYELDFSPTNQKKTKNNIYNLQEKKFS